MTLDLNTAEKWVRQKLKPCIFFHPKYKHLTPPTSHMVDPCKCFEKLHYACPIEARRAQLSETKQAQEPEHLSMRHENPLRGSRMVLNIQEAQQRGDFTTGHDSAGTLSPGHKKARSSSRP
jgi:hypothetical protein